MANAFDRCLISKCGMESELACAMHGSTLAYQLGHMAEFRSANFLVTFYSCALCDAYRSDASRGSWRR